ncbi:hypothetical protein ACTFIU_005091 [Dictyostelium citrinum]
MIYTSSEGDWFNPNEIDQDTDCDEELHHLLKLGCSGVIEGKQIESLKTLFFEQTIEDRTKSQYRARHSIFPNEDQPKYSVQFSKYHFDFNLKEGEKCKVGVTLKDKIKINSTGSSKTTFNFCNIPVHSPNIKLTFTPSSGVIKKGQSVEVLVEMVVLCTTRVRELIAVDIANSGRHLFTIKIDSKMSQVLDYKELEIGNVIGGGGYGAIYKAKWRGLSVAVKVISELSDGSEFEKELEMHKELLHHPNIVHFVGFCVSPKCLVLEYIEGGSLDKYLHNPNYTFSPQLRLKMANDIAKGMCFLHRNEILHLDLKPQNFLVVSISPEAPVSIKLADFGLATSSSRSFYGPTVEGSFLYMSPEVFTQKKFSRAADVWSYGACLIEILTNKRPYQEYDQLGYLELARVREEGLPPMIPPEIEGDLRKIIEACFHRDHTKRPNFENIEQFLDAMTESLFGVPSSIDSSSALISSSPSTTISSNGTGSSSSSPINNNNINNITNNNNNNNNNNSNNNSSNNNNNNNNSIIQQSPNHNGGGSGSLLISSSPGRSTPPLKHSGSFLFSRLQQQQQHQQPAPVLSSHHPSSSPPTTPRKATGVPIPPFSLPSSLLQQYQQNQLDKQLSSSPSTSSLSSSSSLSTSSSPPNQPPPPIPMQSSNSNLNIVSTSPTSKPIVPLRTFLSSSNDNTCNNNSNNSSNNNNNSSNETLVKTSRAMTDLTLSDTQKSGAVPSRSVTISGSSFIKPISIENNNVNSNNNNIEATSPEKYNSHRPLPVLPTSNSSNNLNGSIISTSNPSVSSSISQMSQLISKQQQSQQQQQNIPSSRNVIIPNNNSSPNTSSTNLISNNSTTTPSRPKPISTTTSSSTPQLPIGGNQHSHRPLPIRAASSFEIKNNHLNLSSSPGDLFSSSPSTFEITMMEKDTEDLTKLIELRSRTLKCLKVLYYSFLDSIKSFSEIKELKDCIELGQKIRNFKKDVELQCIEHLKLGWETIHEASKKFNTNGKHLQTCPSPHPSNFDGETYNKVVQFRDAAVIVGESALDGLFYLMLQLLPSHNNYRVPILDVTVSSTDKIPEKDLIVKIAKIARSLKS